jgi:hypothetical protein
MAVAWRTSRGADSESFFIGNRSSRWYLVAFGMIGTSLSGVTFVSVPGAVGREGFAYFQLVLGLFVGYLVIAYVLLPIYYRAHVTSIYDFLEERLGPVSHRTGALFFILSRTLGRHRAPLSRRQHPAGGDPRRARRAVLAHRGGVRGDDRRLHLPGRREDHRLDRHAADHVHAGGACHHLRRVALEPRPFVRREPREAARARPLTIFFLDPDATSFFPKQFVAGMFIAIAMTGWTRR